MNCFIFSNLLKIHHSKLCLVYSQNSRMTNLDKTKYFLIHNVQYTALNHIDVLFQLVQPQIRCCLSQRAFCNTVIEHLAVTMSLCRSVKVSLNKCDVISEKGPYCGTNSVLLDQLFLHFYDSIFSSKLRSEREKCFQQMLISDKYHRP